MAKKPPAISKKPAPTMKPEKAFGGRYNGGGKQIAQDSKARTGKRRSWTGA